MRETHTRPRASNTLLLITVPSTETLYRAVGNWHELAKRIGSTESRNPKAFLEELMDAYPETSVGARRVNFDTNAQVRWIIGKLIGRGVQNLYELEATALPKSYTPSNISLATSFPEYDLREFMGCVRALESKAS